MNSPSIVTLAKGRTENLVNLVRGLALSDEAPCELIIGVMQDEAYDLPDLPWPVRQLMLGSGLLSLAHARNAGARAALGKRLIFLDVDCIPSPSLVGDYGRAMDMADGLLMGEVLYLPSGATTGGVDFDRFARLGVKHSERAGPPVELIGACSDYRCFWSLNFAMRRDLFLDVGGFDEGYVGYGGEDTDFGRTVQTAGAAIHWVRGARAYHQYHPHHMPPVHHLASVLANAERFKSKWGHHTMEHWLRAFELLGLIERRGGSYHILRQPNDADLALTRQQSHQPYASTASVLALLEEQAAERAAAVSESVIA